MLKSYRMVIFTCPAQPGVCLVVTNLLLLLWVISLMTNRIGYLDFLKILLSSFGSLMVLQDWLGLLRVPQGFLRFLMIPQGSIRFLRVSLRFLSIPQDSPQDSLGFPRVPQGSVGFLRVPQVSLWAPQGSSLGILWVP